MTTVRVNVDGGDTSAEEPAVEAPASEQGSPEALRILILSPALSYPPRGGFTIRVFHLVRELVRRGHAVTLLAHGADGHAAAALRNLGIEVLAVADPRRRRPLVAVARALVSRHSLQWHGRFSPSMQAAITQLLGEDRHDVIQIESGEFWRYRYDTRSPLVLDAHNIWSELQNRILATEPLGPRRLYRTLDTAKLRAEERRAWSMLDACLATSDRERQIMEGAGARRAAIVPNGVDTEAFTPRPDVSPIPGRLVFTGVIRYRPNADAVRFLVRDLLPRIRERRPDATLDVVGHGLTPSLRRLAGSGIEMTGEVPDVRPWLAQASVAVVPIRSGSGTRLKILEAFAMGRPVVSTSIGAEGLDVVPGTHLLIADDPESFARVTARLLDDPDEANAIGRAGRELVEQRYDWRMSVVELERSLRALVADARR